MRLKTLFFTAALCLLLVACGKAGYIVEGNIIDLDEGEISLLDAYGHTLSMTTVEDGRFTFKGVVETPCLAYINNARGVKYPIDIPILLENAKIKVTGDARISHVDITGTKANEDMVEFKLRKDALAPDDTEGYLSLVKEMFERDGGNVLGAMLISNLYNYVSDRELLDYCNRLSPEFHDDPVVSHYWKVSQARIDTEPGNMFKDFAMTGQDSIEVRLSEVVSSSKATVLLFWASWSREASSIIPELTALCRPYEGKGLSLFSVSLDSSMDKWTEAEREFGLFGKSFCNGPEAGDKAAGLYGFEGLPRMVLIDSQGKIVARGRTVEDISDGLIKLFE